MKISREYLLGLGSGLILSALLALVFIPAAAKSSGTTGVTATTAATTSSPEEASLAANASPSSQTIASSAQGSSSSEKSASENTAQSKRSFVIPSGASADKIAQLLQVEGWIQKKEDFSAMAKAKKLENRFKAGTYDLVPGLAIEDIINRLIR